MQAQETPHQQQGDGGCEQRKGRRCRPFPCRSSSSTLSSRLSRTRPRRCRCWHGGLVVLSYYRTAQEAVGQKEHRMATRVAVINDDTAVLELMHELMLEEVHESHSYQYVAAACEP